MSTTPVSATSVSHSLSYKTGLAVQNALSELDQTMKDIRASISESVLSLVTPVKGLSTVTQRKTIRCVEDIPFFGSSGSISSENSYTRLVDWVREHPFILKDSHSSEFTFDSQVDLDNIMWWMLTDDDPCELVRICRTYYERYRMADAEVFERLEQFCSQHPEVLNSESYDAGMAWKYSDRRKLGRCLDGIHDQEMKQRDKYQRAMKFLGTVPFSLDG